MLKVVKAAGFKGYMGIEYEGAKLSEEEGIKKTKSFARTGRRNYKIKHQITKIQRTK